MRIAESVSHRIFERTLRPLVFRGACLFERHYNHSSSRLVLGFAVPRPLKSVAVPVGSTRSNTPRVWVR